MSNKKKQSKYDLVDPKEMNQEELDQLLVETTRKKKIYETEEKTITKRIKGKLWLWWFLPFFGPVVYWWTYQKRLGREENQKLLIAIKTKVAECQVQEVFIKRRQTQLDLAKKD